MNWCNELCPIFSLPSFLKEKVGLWYHLPVCVSAPLATYERSVTVKRVLRRQLMNCWQLDEWSFVQWKTMDVPTGFNWNIIPFVEAFTEMMRNFEVMLGQTLNSFV
jgi:hypothetical protein